jgi:hypothetical protein
MNLTKFGFGRSNLLYQVAAKAKSAGPAERLEFTGNRATLQPYGGCRLVRALHKRQPHLVSQA